MSGKKRTPLSAQMAIGLALCFAPCLIGCDLPFLGGENSPSTGPQTLVTSHFFLNYRQYFSRKTSPTSFDDLSPTSHFITMERHSSRNDANDYTLRVVRNGLIGDSRIYLDLEKAPTAQQGIESLFVRFLFYIKPQDLEAGKTLSCKFGYTQGANRCEVIGTISPQPQAPNQPKDPKRDPWKNDLTFLPGLFPKKNPITCQLTFLAASDEIEKSERSLSFPSSKDSAEANLLLGVLFDCFHPDRYGKKITAAQGYFLQNFSDLPSLTPKSDTIERMKTTRPSTWIQTRDEDNE